MRAQVQRLLMAAAFVMAVIGVGGAPAAAVSAAPAWAPAAVNNYVAPSDSGDLSTAFDSATGQFVALGIVAARSGWGRRPAIWSAPSATLKALGRSTAPSGCSISLRAPLVHAGMSRWPTTRRPNSLWPSAARCRHAGQHRPIPRRRHQVHSPIPGRGTARSGRSSIRPRRRRPRVEVVRLSTPAAVSC